MADVEVILEDADPHSTPRFAIDVEVRGLAGRDTVAAPSGPDEVRGAVEKALRRMGLATIER